MDKPNFLFIAPMPPHRGGIPLHSYHLARNLKEIHVVEVWTPTKLFPAFLYPGRNQFDWSSPEASLSAAIVDKNISFLSMALKLLRTKQNGFSAVLLPWWTTYFSLHMLAGSLLLKFRGIKSGVFCHNVFPHNANKFEQNLAKFVLRRFKLLYVQTAEEHDLLKSFHPSAKVEIVSQPAYPVTQSTQLKTRPKGKLFERVKVLFFGFVRDYKGVDVFLNSAVSLPENLFEFHVAGEVWDDAIGDEIQALCQLQGNLTSNLEFVGEETMVHLFSTYDVLVLPYKKATGSAVLSKAKGFGMPAIISTAVDPGIGFVAGRDGLIFDAMDKDGLNNALLSFSDTMSDFSSCWTRDDGIYTWGDLATLIGNRLGDDESWSRA